MDEKKVREAIEAFQGQVNWLKRIDDKECEEARKCCIEYFETAIETLEKQLPKKVDIMDYPLDDINFRCPVCKSEYICEKEHEHFYCPTCGQKLDWTVEE